MNNKLIIDFKKYNGFNENTSDEKILEYITNFKNICLVKYDNVEYSFYGNPFHSEDGSEIGIFISILHPIKRTPLEYWKIKKVLPYFNLHYNEYEWKIPNLYSQTLHYEKVFFGYGKCIMQQYKMNPIKCLYKRVKTMKEMKKSNPEFFEKNETTFSLKKLEFYFPNYSRDGTCIEDNFNNFL